MLMRVRLRLWNIDGDKIRAVVRWAVELRIENRDLVRYMLCISLLPSAYGPRYKRDSKGPAIDTVIKGSI